MRTLPLVLALALGPLAIACGSSEDDGGGEEKGPPKLEFQGLAEAMSEPQGDAAVVTLKWFPAKSDAQVRYVLRTWMADPRRPDAPPADEEDATPDGPCGKAGCRYVVSGTPPDAVRWFAVEAQVVPQVEGKDPVVAGGDVVLPAVIWASAPVISSFSPTTAAPGDEVSVVGEHLLSERMWDDAVRVGEVVVPAANIKSWNNIGLTFVVPDGAPTGKISIRTAAPTAATSADDLVVQ